MFSETFKHTYNYQEENDTSFSPAKYYLSAFKNSPWANFRKLLESHFRQNRLKPRNALLIVTYIKISFRSLTKYNEMAYRLKPKRTRKHATLNSLTETAILSLVAKLGLKCHSLQMKKPKIYKNMRKIKYSTTEQKHMELCTNTINWIKKILTTERLFSCWILNYELVKATQYAVPKKNNLDWKNNTDSI